VPYFADRSRVVHESPIAGRAAPETDQFAIISTLIKRRRQTYVNKSSEVATARTTDLPPAGSWVVGATRRVEASSGCYGSRVSLFMILSTRLRGPMTLKAQTARSCGSVRASSAR
jgi:hypothetical protein